MSGTTAPKTSDLCDAGVATQVCALPFVSYGARHAFSGTIQTVRYAGGIGLLRELVREPAAGRVLVIDGAGYLDGALFGDMMASHCLQNGWAGVVVNGFVRDTHELGAMDIGVKALGTCPRRANLQAPGWRDVPVTFGKTTFTPGWMLAADSDGVVVWPPPS